MRVTEPEIKGGQSLSQRAPANIPGRLAAGERLGDDPSRSRTRLTRRYAVVRAAWDDEPKAWFVEESDIPGLATEAETLEALRRKVPALIQDLLKGASDRPDEIELDFIAYAHDRVRFAA